MSPSQASESKPIIGITLGDTNGVGPELILKTLQDNRITKFCIPVLYGNYKIFARYKKLLSIPNEDFSVHSIRSIQELQPKKINLVTCWDEDYDIQPGTPTKESGRMAFLSLEKAVEDALKGTIHAICTAPIDKKNIQQEGFEFAGHTEYLAKKCGVSDNLMLMVSPLMKIGLATTHTPLSNVSKQLNKDRLLSKINLLYRSLKDNFQIAKPKIALLGLNPHAGESGMMGNEEQELLIPIIKELQDKGLYIYGPYPSDGFFGQHQYKKFDGVLALYHDQGLIPFKTLSFDDGVNFTAGLPILRTSPDHGTAYDKAGKFTVEEESFRQSLFLAIDLVKNKWHATV
ncbi:MAG: 4-hydroxythreonine-4-phosphate dehydrogenase PdxA [Cytophagaceae bacterium]|jgi:4-hydroxythreonine-4-phosphate dehydrogenase|nr:4-hydroxythreonine-4-phosphate dehydrogenase PdxA [Cytophagaceae bacterium]